MVAITSVIPLTLALRQTALQGPGEGEDQTQASLALSALILIIPSVAQ